MQGIHPDGVLSHIGFPRGLHAVVVEGNDLALLTKDEIAVGILQGKTAIATRSHALDGETATAVGARYAHHGLRMEKGVLEIIVETYQNALDRLQVLGIQTVA